MSLKRQFNIAISLLFTMSLSACSINAKQMSERNDIKKSVADVAIDTCGGKETVRKVDANGFECK